MVSVRPVAPTRALAGYIGGKRQLAKLLVQRIEAVLHETYAEAFVGMGAARGGRRHDRDRTAM